MAGEFRHSLHPSLQPPYAAAMTGEASGALPRDVPYPTREQYLRSEAQYHRERESTSTTTGGGAAVRQPPTMLAAMQREDLSQEARRKVLHRLAPQAPLERKYKVLFDSSARRDAAAPLGHAFEVDVTPDLLAPRVHGFEVVGYSVPQAEWAVEPNQGDIPLRCGWGGAEGARELTVRVEWEAAAAMGGSDAAVFGTRSSAPASFAPSPLLLRAVLPLYRNPILSLRRAAEPGWVRLSLAAEPGTGLAALLALRESLPILSLDGAGDPEAAGSLPSPVPLLGIRVPGTGGEAPGPPPPPFAAALLPPQIEVRVPEAAWAQLREEAAAEPGTETLPATPEAPLGFLACRPAATLEELRARIASQLRAELSRAREEGRAGPLTSVRLAASRPGGAASGPPALALELWLDAEAGTAAYAGIAASVHGDALSASLSLAGLAAEARGRGVLTLAAPGPPALALAPSPPRVPPLPEGVAAELYPRAMDALAAAMFLGPQPGAADPDSFAVPVRFAGGVHMVSVPSGEYASAAQLAGEIERRAAAVPALRALRLRVSAADPGAPASAALAFAGAVPFGLAFHLAETDAQLPDPARLGFRRIPYEGAARYEGVDPFPASFPSVLVAGALAAPPTVPTVLAAAASAPRRLLLAHLPKPPAAVLAAAAPAPELPALRLSLRRAVRAHPLQPLRLAFSLPADALRFAGALGAAEGAAPGGEQEGGQGAAGSAPLLLAPLPGTAPWDAAGPAAFAAARDFFAALHDPLAPAAGALFDLSVRLLGARGRSYGGRPAPGTMDADGPYRVLLAATSSDPAALRALDALLDNIAAGAQLRASVGAVGVLLRRLVAAPPLNGTPLHLQPPPLSALAALNGGVASEGLAILLEASAEPAAAPAALAPAAALASLVAAAARAAPLPSALSGAPLVPGLRYALPRDVLGAAPAPGSPLDPARVRFAPGSLYVAPGPSAPGDAVALVSGSGAPALVRPVAAFVEDGSSATLAAYAGAPLAVTFDPAELAFLHASPEDAALGLEANAALGTVALTPRHNLAVPAITLAFARLSDPSGAPVVTTLLVEDSPATLLAKMLLVASNYSVSFPAHAVAASVTASPTELAALPALPAWAGVAPLALDPRFLATELASIVLSTAGGSAALHLVNDLPSSLDYASAPASPLARLRPERLGFAAGTETASPMLPGNSVALGSVAAPNDAERGAPPYLLMSIALLGAASSAGALEDTAAAARSFSHLSTQGEVFSLAAGRSDATCVIRATAYVQVTSENGGLRLLDRQDDRTPVLLPNACIVGAVRFAFHRPDGSPYDFHGRRVMVALRFFTQTDNPAFFAAAGREG